MTTSTDPSTPIADRPIADRPIVPAEYGVPEGADDLVPWDAVEARLTEARVYWVATSGPGGRPRVRPVDGIYLDGVLYLGGSPKTRWYRDLTENPKVAVHLDDGSDVVILEGVAGLPSSGLDDALAERLAASSNHKYPQYNASPADYRGPGLVAIRPHVAFAWRKFPADVTRFRFPAEGG